MYVFCVVLLVLHRILVTVLVHRYRQTQRNVCVACAVCGVAVVQSIASADLCSYTRLHRLHRLQCDGKDETFEARSDGVHAGRGYPRMV